MKDMLPAGTARSFSQLGLSALYPNNIIHLMSTAAVLPLSRAEVERVFSQIKLVKCNHRNRMKQTER